MGFFSWCPRTPAEGNIVSCSYSQVQVIENNFVILLL